MDQYLLYLVIVTITVASPGPGVVLTLSNAIRYGTKPALSGVLGISFGIFIIALISASSLGVLLAASSVAFSILKYMGAAYLIYLGTKLWRSPALKLEENIGESLGKKIEENREGSIETQPSYGLRFKEGFFITLLNPKPVFFFMSLFPQFINHQQSYIAQFTALTLTFCITIIVVHSTYTFAANSIKSWLVSPRGSKWVNRTGGSVFVLFGLGLATTTQR